MLLLIVAAANLDEDQSESVSLPQENGSDLINDEVVIKMSNAIHHVLKQSLDLFSSVIDKDIKDEVLDAQETEKFVLNLVQVFRVFKRLRISYETINKSSSEDIDDIFESIESVWRTILKQFVSKSSLIPNNSLWDFSDCIINSSFSGDNSFCGICHLSLNKTSKEINSNLVETVITYQSTSYHSICINFWINCVNESLPNQ